MRRVAILLSGLMLGSVAAVLGAAPACACSCAGAPEAELAATATAIFVGTLVDRQVDDSQPIISSGDPAWLTFEVHQVYRGEVAASQVVVTARDGATCGLELSGTGPFLVFAEAGWAGEPGTLSASLCGGTRPLADGPPDPTLGTPSAPTAGLAGGPSGSDQLTASVFGLAGTDSPVTAAAVGLAAVAGLGWFAVAFRRRRAG